jgi:hypothetical protein
MAGTTITTIDRTPNTSLSLIRVMLLNAAHREVARRFRSKAGIRPNAARLMRFLTSKTRMVIIFIDNNNSSPAMKTRPRHLLAALAALPVIAFAATPEISIVIKDHRFAPAEVKIPAGQKVKLIIDNQDATPEEFESHELNREKVIAPKSKGTVFIGPLKAGRYPFIGEFNESTAKGVVVAE